MTKINIKTIITLKDEELLENVIGSIESSIISYQESNNTYVYLDINRDELIRENEELTMKYIFTKNQITKGNIFIKEFNQDLDLEIKTNLLEKENNKYKVEYCIGEDTFIYEINYSEV